MPRKKRQEESVSDSDSNTRHHYHHSHLPNRHVYQYYRTSGVQIRGVNQCGARACLWVFAFCVFIMVFLLVLILPLRYSSDENKDNLDYAPVDTSIISFSHPFCARLTLHSPETPVADFPIIATISLVSKAPSLERLHRSVYYRESVLQFDQYEFWRLFLYPGSNVNYSACTLRTDAGPWGEFYLVQGDRNFEKWKSGDFENFIVKEDIEALCTDDRNSTFSYQVGEEDHYYMIVKSADTKVSTLAITFTFNRLLYSIANGTLLDQCSVMLNDTSASDCHVDIPLHSKSTALLDLQTLIPDFVDWDANIVVDVQCGARAWLYVIIAFSSVAFVALLVLVAVVVYWFCCRKRQRRKTTAQEREDSNLVRRNEEEDNGLYDSYSAKPE